MSWALIAYTVWLKFSSLALLAYIVKLRRDLRKYSEGPTAYMCANDFRYELGEDIYKSNSLVHGRLDECKEEMGEKHVEECGIVKVRLVKIEDMVVGKY